MTDKTKGPIQVFCAVCEEWIDEDSPEVDFLDISEGMQGEDIMTFVHTECGTRNESVRRG